jgi:hypothetical protein
MVAHTRGSSLLLLSYNSKLNYNHTIFQLDNKLALGLLLRVESSMSKDYGEAGPNSTPDSP